MSGVMQAESGLRAWIERTRVVRACRFREVCARNAPCVGVLRIETARLVLCAIGGARHSGFGIRGEAGMQRGAWRESRRHQGMWHRGMRRGWGWELVRREIGSSLPGLKCSSSLVRTLARLAMEARRSAEGKRVR